MSTNSISLAEKFLPILDEVYKKNSLTAILDTGANKVKFEGANKCSVFKISMDGLGTYARNSGFVTGGVTGAWESFTLAKDRGRSFIVDAMDNEETLGMAFGSLAGEFMRTKVIPELDAYRFAKYASTSNISSANADITVGTTDCVALIDTALEKMGDDEVPEDGRILFVSEKFYNGVKKNITRYLRNENGVNREVEYYGNMPIIKVPKGRFNTAITLYDGSTQGQTDGGFVPTAGGYPINFMIIHPSALIQVEKHALPRIFAPQVNQTADAWKFDYRIYHDCFVESNKVAGIYLHRASTANA